MGDAARLLAVAPGLKAPVPATGRSVHCSPASGNRLQTGTFRLCLTRFSVKLVLIDCTFGSSTMAFFTVAS